VIRITPSSSLRIPSVPASLLLVSAAVGFLLLVSFTVLTLIPLVVILGAVAVGIVGTLLLAWAAIEGLAAFERWMEQDPRFLR
jgi:hypothetical protein